MYAFCQDMPGITMESQAELTALIPEGALDKCLAHVVGPIDGGIRMIDVWQSEADFREFQQRHLYPAIAKLRNGQPLPDTRGTAPFTTIEVTGAGHSAATVA
jgi:hypothetical protein